MSNNRTTGAQSSPIGGVERQFCTQIQCGYTKPNEQSVPNNDIISLEIAKSSITPVTTLCVTRQFVLCHKQPSKRMIVDKWPDFDRSDHFTGRKEWVISWSRRGNGNVPVLLLLFASIMCLNICLKHSSVVICELHWLTVKRPCYLQYACVQMQRNGPRQSMQTSIFKFFSQTRKASLSYVAIVWWIAREFHNFGLQCAVLYSEHILAKCR